MSVPFESNPPPDAMPDLELDVQSLPFTGPEVTAGSFRSGQADDSVALEQPVEDNEERT